MSHRRAEKRFLAAGILAALALVVMACAGSEQAVAPAPQQPAAAAQPAPSSPAPEPQPATASAPASVAAPKPVSPAASSVEEPKYGGTALFGASRFSIWDPTLSNSSNFNHAVSTVSGRWSLVCACRDDAFKVCPQFAESWESNSDFTQWTFKIRENLFWHDGKRFTAEDAKWWYELWVFGYQSGDKKRSPAAQVSKMGDVKKVEALEGNRLRITLNRPDHLYIQTLGLSGTSVRILHPQHLLQPLFDQGNVNATPLDVGMVGLGPFQWVGQQQDIRVEVRRFDRYWEKDEKGRQLPFLDGVVQAIIGDLNAHDAAFRAGRLDSGARGSPFWVMGPDRKAAYIRDLGDKVWFVEYEGFRQGLMMNTLRPGPLQDVRVRKAIALYIDKQAAIDTAMRGSGELFTLLSAASPWPNPDWRTWPDYDSASLEKNRAEARRLMTEAGYPEGGFKLIMLTRTRSPQYTEFAAGQLSELGIEVIQLIAPRAVYGKTALGIDAWDLKVSGPCVNDKFPEPCIINSRPHGINSNSRFKSEDPKMEEFYQRISSTTDFEERRKIYQEFERYVILDQVYMVPTFATKLTVPYRSYVKGVTMPSGNFDDVFDRVWLDK